VRYSPASCRRWPFGLPVSRHTRAGSPTSAQEKLVSGAYSLVRIYRFHVSGFLTLWSSTAGLGAGTTEAVAVVTPMEVVKIRLQAQQHSLADPLDAPRYRNAGHAVFTIVREEGISALYRGVSLTALRQATNQGICIVICSPQSN